MSEFYPALEAIAFQNGSPLAAELIKIFQSCIDIRELEYDNRGAKVTAVIKYFKDQASGEFIRAIKKHTGMSVSHFHIQNNFNMFFACLMKVGDEYGMTAHDIIDRYSGLSDTKNSNMRKDHLNNMNIKPTTAAEMEKIADSVNIKSGKFGDGLFRKNKIMMELYFDPYSAFLTRDTGHSKFEYLTAEEIAAIMLHEIGHMLSMLEHSADSYFRLKTHELANDHFVKNATRVEKIKYVKSFLEKNFKKKSTIEPKEPMNKDNVVETVFYSIVLFLVMPTMVFLSPVLALVNFLFRAAEEANLQLRDIGNKRSDFASSRINTKYCEQLADEYVSRHGLAGPLTSALAKITHMGQGIGFPTITESSLIYYLGKVPWMIEVMFMGDISSGMTGAYDRTKKRIEQNMLHVLSVFKNSNMPPEMLDVYLKDYETTKAVFTNRKLSDKFVEASELLHKLGTYLFNPVTLASMISSGRFNAEYDNLSERVDRLVDNKLLYRAGKLEQLLNKEYKA